MCPHCESTQALTHYNMHMTSVVFGTGMLAANPLCPMSCRVALLWTGLLLAHPTDDQWDCKVWIVETGSLLQTPCYGPHA